MMSTAAVWPACAGQRRVSGSARQRQGAAGCQAECVPLWSHSHLVCCCAARLRAPPVPHACLKLPPGPACSPCRFELHISTVRLLDYFGGPSDMGPDEYFAAGLGSGTDAEQA